MARFAEPMARLIEELRNAHASLQNIRRALARLRLLGGMHGQYTFETKNGSRTLAFERGTVTSVTGTGGTVRAADGVILPGVGATGTRSGSAE